jgi:hypothetical protein
MIAFHPDYSSLAAAFGQGYVTKLLASLPFLGTYLLLCINLASAKKHHMHCARYVSQ